MAHAYSTRADCAAELDTILQEAVDAGIPGISAAVRSSDGVLWGANVGLSDVQALKRLANDQLFGIGSITKVFVAVVILQLINENRLQLSDTVGNVLHSSIYSDIENASEATVTILLTHEAGIDSWEEDPSRIIDARGKKMNPTRIWEKTRPLDYIRRPKIMEADSGQWHYSNTNYTLLGLMIENIPQNSAEAEIRRRILEPLGMDHTYLEGFEKPQLGVATYRYHWATKSFIDDAGISPSFSQIRSNLLDVTDSNLSTEWTAGGMISSVSDLLKFAIALRDGKLLNIDSLKIIKDWRPTTRAIAEMGHGIFRIGIASDHDDMWVGHFGSVLGFSGALWWQEKGDCAVCVLCNVGTMHTGNAHFSVQDIITKTRFLEVASLLATGKPPGSTS